MQTNPSSLFPLFFDLCLHRLIGVGSVSFAQITDAFGSPKSALASPLNQLQAFIGPEALQQVAELQQLDEKSALGKRVNTDLQWLESHSNAQVLRLDDPTYPALLREAPKPPPLLFVLGDAACLNLPQIGIVGSRNPTSGGQENAYRFAEFLAGNGFAITSGLALGVDAAAHQGALSASGRTIAAMGTGLDIIYPSRNQSLAQQILDQGGALVSELPLGSAAQAAHFPQRNRIISGLSCGILVVEAALKSGSLITAQTAVAQNREVFAIPGSIHNPLARGCHQLIRQGATLVETAQDIVDQLGGLLSFQSDLIQRPMKPKKPPKPIPLALNLEELSLDEQTLLNALGFDPTDIDTLAERTGIAIGSLSAKLIGLEMKGAIQQQGAGTYLRTDTSLRTCI